MVDTQKIACGTCCVCYGWMKLSHIEYYYVCIPNFNVFEQRIKKIQWFSKNRIFFGPRPRPKDFKNSAAICDITIDCYRITDEQTICKIFGSKPTSRSVNKAKLSPVRIFESLLLSINEINKEGAGSSYLLPLHPGGDTFGRKLRGQTSKMCRNVVPGWLTIEDSGHVRFAFQPTQVGWGCG